MRFRFAQLTLDFKVEVLTYCKNEVKDVVDEGEPTPLAPFFAVTIYIEGSARKC